MNDDDLEELEENEEILSSLGNRNAALRNSLGRSQKNLVTRKNNLANKSKSNLSSHNSSSKGNKLAKKNNNSDTVNSLSSKLKPKPLSQRLGLKSKKNNATANNPEEHNDSTPEEDNSHLPNPIEVVARIRRIKLIITLSVIIAVVLLISGIIVAISIATATAESIAESFVNIQLSVPEDELDPNADYYEEAVKYYKNLEEASNMYWNSCRIALDKNYIHGTLTYLAMTNRLDDYQIKDIYIMMNNNVFKVAELMVDNCEVDYEKGGVFYNNLKDSAFLKDYYKEVLEYTSPEALTDAIFSYSELGAQLALLTTMFISDSLPIKMGTCEQPYNNKLLNEGTEYPSTVPLNKYIMGVVYGEVGGSINEKNREFLKAFIIAATSYVLGRTGYDGTETELWVHNGNCWQLSCDIDYGCTYSYDKPGGFGTTYTGIRNKSGRKENPMSQEQRALLESIMSEVFGKVMVNENGTIKTASYRDTVDTCGHRANCLGQKDAMRDAQNGMSYEEILRKYYTNFSIEDISENLYAGDVTYQNGGYNGEVVYYNQNDYKNKFCGRSNATISTSGCGVTSMAMVLSSFVNRQYTPPIVMEEAYSMGKCGAGISGTSASFFKKSAQKHGLSFFAEGKRGNLQSVLDALRGGNSLVIAHMGPGTFTNGGHYIVLSKVNDKGQVYVLDPNKKRRNGWYDFNSVIVKELKGSLHVITKG